MSEGHTFPWERGAMKGMELPDGLTPYDQMAYLSLRTVYRDYHEQRLNRDAAAREKRRIVGAWNKAKRMEEYERRLAFYRAEANKATEGAKKAVLNDPSPENALKLCEALDRVDRYEPEKRKEKEEWNG